MNIQKIVVIIGLVIFSMASLVEAQTTTYQHNGVNQLLEVQQADCTSIIYAYDDNGNRIERIVQPCVVISGVVLNSNGEGIEGVPLSGLPGKPVTDITGFYSVQVAPGWSGTALPQQTDYTFEPVERVYQNLTLDQSDQNYVGVLPHYTLTVQIIGAGSVSGDGGINCPDVCSQTFDAGTLVSLSAIPSSGYLFNSYSGAECDTTGTCVVTITADTTVTITFVADPTITPTPVVTPEPTITPIPPDNPIPEPSTVVYFMIGLLGLLSLRRRKKK